MAAPQTTPPTGTPKAPPRTWKPTVAGILTIIAGVVTLAAEIIYVSAGDFGVFAGIPFIESSANPNGALFATGIIGIAGGVFALLRRIYWLAIVGIVFSMLFPIWPVLVLGITSIICIATSSKEFKRVKSA